MMKYPYSSSAPTSILIVLTSSPAQAKPLRFPKIGLGLFGMHQLALSVPLTEQGAAVAFLSTFSAIGKSRTRGSDRTVNSSKMGKMRIALSGDGNVDSTEKLLYITFKHQTINI